MGIGFAVPIDMAMNIKSQLVANGKVTRGYIGVVINPGDVTEEMAKSFGRGEAGGVLIADVQKDGPADKAGIKSGDIFVELDGKKIKDSTSFRNDVARILPNKKAEITLFRDGKSKKVTVTVGTFPDEEAAAAGGTQEGGDIAEKLGFEVQDLTPEVAEQLGYEEKRGVVISDVDPNSAAYEQGLRTGMLILEVNRSEVKNVSDFEKAAGKVKGGNMLLRIKMKEGSIFLHLRAND
jgi:serine protease Do